MSHSTVIGYSWQPRWGICPALVTAMEEHRPAGYHGGMFRYRQWVLDYSFNALGLYRVQSPSRPWQPRRPSEAHLYPPNTCYWEEAQDPRQTEFHCAYLLFTGGAQCGLAALITGGRGYARFLDTSGRLGEFLRQIAALGARRGEAGFWPAQSRFGETLELLRTATPVEKETYRIAGAPEADTVSDFVLNIQAFLREHVSRPVTLDDLAAHLHVSPSTLSHRYHAETGESPMKTLTRIRLNLARGLLLKGHRVKTIADQLGFSDAFHFSKIFKQHTGLAPRYFCRALRTSAGSSCRNLHLIGRI